MFTGIIEETATINSVNYNNNSAILNICANKVLQNTKIGDSISVNGVCLTVTEINANNFTAFASYETLNLTTLGSLKKGSLVNLERALCLSDRLGGHIVSGHVDAIGSLEGKIQHNAAYELIFSAPKEQMKQIVKKGSVCIDGISLTVADINKDKFSVAVIPHTLESTTLKTLNIGDKVNIETDIISKYVEKYLLSNDNNSNITMDLLERNGFL